MDNDREPIVTEQPAYPQQDYPEPDYSKSDYPPPAYAQSNYPQPGQSQPAYPQQPNTGHTTVVVNQQSPQYVSTTGYIVFSCLVFWCCNWPLGLVAFICAMMASSAADSGDTEQALRCGRIANGFSCAGIVVTVILIIVLVVWAFALNDNTTYSYTG